MSRFVNLEPRLGSTLARPELPPDSRSEDLRTAAGNRPLPGVPEGLENLAERFLANRERAAEIFDSNRGVLARPDLLPVGVTIVLPPRDSGQELEPVKMP